MKYKRITFILIIASIIILAGCTKLHKDKIQGNSLNRDEKVKDEIGNSEETSFNEVDYSKEFGGINGGAVFYYSEKNQYDVYQMELMNKQVSPFSTFKIVSTLMGLEQRIVTTIESTMEYDGTIYSREEWNKDIQLKEAFQTSCVWYYKKLISLLNKDYVEGVLKKLEYGNCDISVWDEKGHNDFWLSSSLKISPIEQVEVLEKIFAKENDFEEYNIELLKEIMFVENKNNNLIYGKTGSGIEKNAWFVGFIENKERIFFAVMIEDENQSLAGNKAKEIALNIIANNYIE